MECLLCKNHIVTSPHYWPRGTNSSRYFPIHYPMSVLFGLGFWRESKPESHSVDSLRLTIVGKKSGETVTAHFVLPPGARDEIVAMYQLVDAMKGLDVALPPLNPDMRVDVTLPGNRVDQLIHFAKASAWTCFDCRT